MTIFLFFEWSQRIFAMQSQFFQLQGYARFEKIAGSGDCRKAKKNGRVRSRPLFPRGDWGMEVQYTILASPERRRKVIMQVYRREIKTILTLH
jgi:hypothetical protein